MRGHPMIFLVRWSVLSWGKTIQYFCTGTKTAVWPNWFEKLITTNFLQNFVVNEAGRRANAVLRWRWIDFQKSRRTGTRIMTCNICACSLQNNKYWLQTSQSNKLYKASRWVLVSWPNQEMLYKCLSVNWDRSQIGNFKW